MIPLEEFKRGLAATLVKEAPTLADFRARLAMLLAVAPGAALASLAPDPAASAEPVREIDRLQSRRPVG